MRNFFIAFFSIIILSGCVDLEAAQRALDRIDSTWDVDNKKLLKTAGVRNYDISKKEAFQAMVITLTELGFIVKNQDLDSGFVYASAPIPTPLTKDEWAQVKTTEEPRMQEIATQEAGSMVGSMFVLSDTNFDTLVNALLLERTSGVQITMNFQMEYTGPKSLVGYGHQPPPEAVKFGIQKFWDHYERVALVQSKILQ